jgi:hypothetical protein
MTKLTCKDCVHYKECDNSEDYGCMEMPVMNIINKELVPCILFATIEEEDTFMKKCYDCKFCVRGSQDVTVGVEIYEDTLVCNKNGRLIEALDEVLLNNEICDDFAEEEDEVYKPHEIDYKGILLF